MNMINLINKCFPYSEMRGQQEYLIKQVINAIEDGYKYIILEAGTGIGKSAIASTLCNIYESIGKNSYILTGTKQLQDQYYNDFSKLGYKVVKGRSNFHCKKYYEENPDLDEEDRIIGCDKGECKYKDTKVTCKRELCKYFNAKTFKCEKGVLNDKGECKALFKKNECKYNCHSKRLSALQTKNYDKAKHILKEVLSTENYCQYWTQKYRAIHSSTCILNYQYALAEFNFIKHFKSRDLLVLDESHNTESMIMNFVSLSLTNKTLISDVGIKIPEELNSEKVDDGWISFLEKLINAYKDELKKVKKELNDKEGLKKLLTQEINKKKDRSSKLERMALNLQNTFSLLSDKNILWIVDIKRGKDTLIRSVSFKPLNVQEFCKEFLLKYGDVVLFMSATILSAALFKKWLGLGDDEVKVIRAESPFKVENRPIYLDLAGKMSYKYKKVSEPLAHKKIKQILEKHKDVKGVIHTNSYEFCKNLIHYLKYNYSDFDRILYHKSSFNRESTLQEYLEDTTNKVLISPSMTEGVDMPYDKCRFQIIEKIPYPSLTDKQVKARMKADNQWYSYQTVMSLLQTYGRGMRAEDDYCDTYIVDSNINMILDMPASRDLVSKYFKEAIKRV